MYRQPSKRQVILQRIAVYGLMSVSVVILVTALILIMLGYQFNRNDGRIEQGGLVQFESRPTGADVSIDGTAFGSQTNSKVTLAAGGHFIKMERSGYGSWQKAVNVVPGSILWLNYARLIPTQLTATHEAELTEITSSVSSEDNKWMAIKESAATPVIKLADVSQDKIRLTNLDLPTNSYTHPAPGKAQSFTLEKWDPESRYILVRHVYDDGKTEWLVVDSRDAANTKNITTLLGINARTVEFSGGNSQLLYVLTDTNVLRRVDLGQASLSGPLLSNIAEFSLHESSIVAYVTLPDSTTGTRGVGYYDEASKKSRLIRAYTDDATLPLHVRINKYFDDMYVAISYGDTVDILVGALPKEDEPSQMKLQSAMSVAGGIQYLSTKTNGRFVVAQSGGTFGVYDLELKKIATTKTSGSSDVTREFDWIDSYMPWSDRDGKLRFYEFDGANQHNIMDVVPGQSVTLSPSGKYVYGVSKQVDGKVYLSRVQLILG